MSIWAYAIGSVLLVSVVSFIGAVTLAFRIDTLKRMLLYLVSFAAGAFFGDVFFHMLPEIIEIGFTPKIAGYLLFGVIFTFTVEKFIRWRHCHVPEKHVHPVALMNLVGDGVHNLIDGIIIGASYVASIPLGIATTLAVLFHEIPQEIGDFGILLHGGFTKEKALFFNFLTAMVSLIGVVFAVSLSGISSSFFVFILPFAAGNFLYIAGSDLIPELHEHVSVQASLLQLFFFVAGIIVMAAILLLE